MGHSNSTQVIKIVPEPTIEQQLSDCVERFDLSGLQNIIETQTSLDFTFDIRITFQHIRYVGKRFSTHAYWYTRTNNNVKIEDEDEKIDEYFDMLFDGEGMIRYSEIVEPIATELNLVTFSRKEVPEDLPYMNNEHYTMLQVYQDYKNITILHLLCILFLRDEIDNQIYGENIYNEMLVNLIQMVHKKDPTLVNAIDGDGKKSINYIRQTKNRIVKNLLTKVTIKT